MAIKTKDKEYNINVLCIEWWELALEKVKKNKSFLICIIHLLQVRPTRRRFGNYKSNQVTLDTRPVEMSDTSGTALK